MSFLLFQTTNGSPPRVEETFLCAVYNFQSSQYGFTNGNKIKKKIKQRPNLIHNI